MTNEHNCTDQLKKIIKKIIFKQDNFVNPCLKKLGCEDICYNTIPMTFICCNSCQTFTIWGLYKDNNNKYIKFETSIFRVTKIENDCLVLELLQLQPDEIIRTNVFINVDVNIFCGYECLDKIYAKIGVPTANNKLLIVNVTYYITFSDGQKRIFVNEDGYNDFNVILNPTNYSYANLFINAVLQPDTFYTISEGKLELLTDDVPLTGSSIILQMIEISF